MPKLTCICGETISLGSIPGKSEFTLLPEVLQEDIVGDIVDACHSKQTLVDFEKSLFKSFSHVKHSGILHLVECPYCNRLAIFARASDDLPVFWFQREVVSLLPEASNLSSLVDNLIAGELPIQWQKRRDKA